MCDWCVTGGEKGKCIFLWEGVRVKKKSGGKIVKVRKI